MNAVFDYRIRQCIPVHWVRETSLRGSNLSDPVDYSAHRHTLYRETNLMQEVLRGRDTIEKG